MAHRDVRYFVTSCRRLNFPDARSALTLNISAVVNFRIGGLPILLPCFLAFRIPSLVLSAMRDRSNAATAPNTVKIILPAAVLVSTCSEIETNSTPSYFKCLQRPQKV